ncbi:unnamed protein product [Brassica oleracea]|nr:unnamed protein product [Brassica napus]
MNSMKNCYPCTLIASEDKNGVFDSEMLLFVCVFFLVLHSLIGSMIDWFTKLRYLSANLVQGV